MFNIVDTVFIVFFIVHPSFLDLHCLYIHEIVKYRRLSVIE